MNEVSDNVDLQTNKRCKRKIHILEYSCAKEYSGAKEKDLSPSIIKIGLKNILSFHFLLNMGNKNIF